MRRHTDTSLPPAHVPFNPEHIAHASQTLFDVVVLAGGDGSRMTPVSDGAKCLAPLLGRPLLWYVLLPWVHAGCRRFYLCAPKAIVNDLREDIGPLFSSRSSSSNTATSVASPIAAQPVPASAASINGVSFEYVETDVLGATDAIASGASKTDATTGNVSGKDLSATSGGNEPSPSSVGPPRTAQALRCYHQYKLRHKQPLRDVLVISGDTIACGLDLTPFIHHFYTSLSSFSALLYTKPELPPPPKQPGNDDAAAAGHKEEPRPQRRLAQSDTVFVLEPMPQDFDTVVEPGHRRAEAVIASGHACGSDGSGVSSDDAACAGVLPGGCCAHRMHFAVAKERLVDEDGKDDSQYEFRMGFLARRPHLSVTTDCHDSMIYLMRKHIVDAICEHHTSDWRSLQHDVLPSLCTAQFVLTNHQASADGKYVTPAKRLRVHPSTLPPHWSVASQPDVIASYNAVHGAVMDSLQSFPEDVLRVHAFVIPLALRPGRNATRIVRVTTAANFMAVTRELLSWGVFPDDVWQQRPPQSSFSSLVAPHLGFLARASTPSYLVEQHRRNWTESASSTSPDKREAATLLGAAASPPPDQPRLLIQRSVILAPVSTLPAVCDIVDSVVCDGVVLGERCKIFRSVLLTGCEVASGCVVSDAIIGRRVTVANKDGGSS